MQSSFQEAFSFSVSIIGSNPSAFRRTGFRITSLFWGADFTQTFGGTVCKSKRGKIASATFSRNQTYRLSAETIFVTVRRSTASVRTNPVHRTEFYQFDALPAVPEIAFVRSRLSFHLQAPSEHPS